MSRTNLDPLKPNSFSMALTNGCLKNPLERWIASAVKDSIIIIYLLVNNSEVYKKLTYKNKVYNDNVVISEEKINVSIDSIENAEKLLIALGFKNIIEVKYDVIVYKKDDIELAFQDVENLGLLLEFESTKDYEGYAYDEILLEKKKMLDIVRSFGIDTTDDYDIKKAYELIKKEV